MARSPSVRMLVRNFSYHLKYGHQRLWFSTLWWYFKELNFTFFQKTYWLKNIFTNSFKNLIIWILFRQHFSHPLVNKKRLEITSYHSKTIIFAFLKISSQYLCYWGSSVMKMYNSFVYHSNHRKSRYIFIYFSQDTFHSF